MEEFHWMVRVEAGCNVARKSLRWARSRNQPGIVDPIGRMWKVLEGGGKDKRGRGWMATMERRTWDLYIRAAESRGGEVISVPVAD
ncbi:hypothetical protein N7530_003244 [Penicillium desertorum]|uniref:Uncharacterized protein n=1 Tax=Penicillium desertorum TaxID=1303715 RepID=A0A9W9WVZ4_9EURO|nr:hypothetical protein N7530_003244 [Penicillium desertorum]